MGLVLLFLGLSLCICALTFLLVDSRGISDKIGGAVSAAIICFFVFGFFSIVIIGFSYANYVGLKQRIATIEQYKSAIGIYSDRGILDFKKNEMGNFERIGDLTDLKYQNYQENVYHMIKDFRNEVVKYNRKLVGKRTMKANWFWNWLIIAPDSDMKIMRLE